MTIHFLAQVLLCSLILLFLYFLIEAIGRDIITFDKDIKKFMSIVFPSKMDRIESKIASLQKKKEEYVTRLKELSNDTTDSITTGLKEYRIISIRLIINNLDRKINELYGKIVNLDNKVTINEEEVEDA